MKWSLVPSFRCRTLAPMKAASCSATARIVASRRDRSVVKPGTIGAISTPALTPAFLQRANRAQALQRVSGPRLERGPGAFVDSRDADGDRAVGSFPQFGEQVGVANDHRSLGDQPNRRARRDRAPRAPAASACSDLRSADRGPSPCQARPARASRTASRARGAAPPGSYLDEDDRRELVVRPERELRLIPAREAVVAGVRAAPVGIERPLEGHTFDRVQRRAAGHFLIAGVVGASLRLIQPVGAVADDCQGDGAGRGRRGWRIEEARRVHGDIRFLFAIIVASAPRCQWGQISSSSLRRWQPSGI